MDIEANGREEMTREELEQLRQKLTKAYSDFVVACMIEHADETYESGIDQEAEDLQTRGLEAVRDYAIEHYKDELALLLGGNQAENQDLSQLPELDLVILDRYEEAERRREEQEADLTNAYRSFLAQAKKTEDEPEVNPEVIQDPEFDLSSQDTLEEMREYVSRKYRDILDTLDAPKDWIEKEFPFSADDKLVLNWYFDEVRYVDTAAEPEQQTSEMQAGADKEAQDKFLAEAEKQETEHLLEIVNTLMQDDPDMQGRILSDVSLDHIEDGTLTGEEKQILRDLVAEYVARLNESRPEQKDDAKSVPAEEPEPSEEADEPDAAEEMINVPDGAGEVNAAELARQQRRMEGEARESARIINIINDILAENVQAQDKYRKETDEKERTRLRGVLMAEMEAFGRAAEQIQVRRYKDSSAEIEILLDKLEEALHDARKATQETMKAPAPQAAPEEPIHRLYSMGTSEEAEGDDVPDTGWTLEELGIIDEPNPEEISKEAGAGINASEGAESNVPFDIAEEIEVVIPEEQPEPDQKIPEQDAAKEEQPEPKEELKAEVPTGEEKPEKVVSEDEKPNVAESVEEKKESIHEEQQPKPEQKDSETDAAKEEQPKPENELKPEELKPEEPKAEEPKAEEPKPEEEPKAEEPKAEETKAEETSEKADPDKIVPEGADLSAAAEAGEEKAETKVENLLNLKEEEMPEPLPKTEPNESILHAPNDFLDAVVPETDIFEGVDLNARFIPDRSKIDPNAYYNAICEQTQNLIDAESFFSRDSNQYKALRQTLVDVVEKGKNLDEAKLKEFFANITDAVGQYQEHADRHAKPDNVRRNTRLRICDKLLELADKLKRGVIDPLADSEVIVEPVTEKHAEAVSETNTIENAAPQEAEPVGVEQNDPAPVSTETAETTPETGVDESVGPNEADAPSTEQNDPAPILEEPQTVSENVASEESDNIGYGTEQVDPAAYYEALCELNKDLTAAGSIFSWDSDQYKNLKSLLDEIAESEKGSNVKQLKSRFEDVTDAVKEYQAHAERHPKSESNVRRNTRLEICEKLLTLADDLNQGVMDPKAKYQAKAKEALVDYYCEQTGGASNREVIEQQLTKKSAYRKAMKSSIYALDVIATKREALEKVANSIKEVKAKTAPTPVKEAPVAEKHSDKPLQL